MWLAMASRTPVAEYTEQFHCAILSLLTTRMYRCISLSSDKFPLDSWTAMAMSRSRITGPSESSEGGIGCTVNYLSQGPLWGMAVRAMNGGFMPFL
ncbi:hypothetical protein AQI88_18440 [Streptomyces cellostaticus]|uniref:Uncharacterized protein n=1 Tax=Streptomyces cellostaticus TaxID=67285 RepID=A0A101NKH7_9ACTN|nr:hypothetical protein AQI88_18440 [Streptomyces cellostaticus]